MEIVALVGATLMGGAISAVWSWVASVAFVLLASMLPVYVALYRRCIRRALILVWVVLVADLGLVGMPPLGLALWGLALAYALAPRRRRKGLAAGPAGAARPGLRARVRFPRLTRGAAGAR